MSSIDRQVVVIDYSAQMKEIVGRKLRNLIEASAIIMADEVKAVINESSPAGRRYYVPELETHYIASAPGQPPAIREGLYFESIKWTPAVRVGNTIEAYAYTDRTVGKNNEHILGDILEHGTQNGRIAPRPHWRPAIVRAGPKIVALIQRAKLT